MLSWKSKLIEPAMPLPPPSLLHLGRKGGQCSQTIWSNPSSLSSATSVTSSPLLAHVVPGGPFSTFANGDWLTLLLMLPPPGITGPSSSALTGDAKRCRDGEGGATTYTIQVISPNNLGLQSNCGKNVITVRHVCSSWRLGASTRDWSLPGSFLACTADDDLTATAVTIGRFTSDTALVG